MIENGMICNEFQEHPFPWTTSLHIEHQRRFLLKTRRGWDWTHVSGSSMLVPLFVYLLKVCLVYFFFTMNFLIQFWFEKLGTKRNIEHKVRQNPKLFWCNFLLPLAVKSNQIWTRMMKLRMHHVEHSLYIFG